MDMTRKTLVRGMFGMAVAAPLALAGCSRGSSGGGGATTEGVDTPCEVTGYTPYAGSHPGAFPAPGDRVAVISPLAMDCLDAGEPSKPMTTQSGRPSCTHAA